MVIACTRDRSSLSLYDVWSLITMAVAMRLTPTPLIHRLFLFLKCSMPLSVEMSRCYVWFVCNMFVICLSVCLSARSLDVLLMLLITELIGYVDTSHLHYDVLTNATTLLSNWGERERGRNKARDDHSSELTLIENGLNPNQSTLFTYVRIIEKRKKREMDQKPAVLCLLLLSYDSFLLLLFFNKKTKPIPFY